MQKTTTKNKNIVQRYSSLTKIEKIQLFVAIGFTLASIIVAPVFAWFSFQTKVETMSYVNDPPTLSLASGHQDSIQFFQLKNIDVKRLNDGSYYQDFVFSVETEKALEYDLQLCHTTNIPFTYELWRAKEDVSGTVSYIVQEGSDIGKTIQYTLLTGNLTDGDITISQDITLTSLNPQTISFTNENEPTISRDIGCEEVLESKYSRKNYEQGDNYNQFVEPLYSVARHIQTNEKTFDGSEERDYFVLRVKWNVKNEAQGNEYWYYGFNDKETDIVYVSVKESRDSVSNADNEGN